MQSPGFMSGLIVLVLLFYLLMWINTKQDRFGKFVPKHPLKKLNNCKKYA